MAPRRVRLTDSDGDRTVTDVPIIPDVNTLNTSFSVPKSAGRITDLDVSLSIAHSFDGDLDVTLTHVPTATTVILFQDVGGSNEGFSIRLNDEAGTDISGASNPKADGMISGTFNPGGRGGPQRVRRRGRLRDLAALDHGRLGGRHGDAVRLDAVRDD